jgi:hypothetical protein
MLVDKRINAPKGKIMGLKSSVTPERMGKAATQAMQTRQQSDLDYMFGLIRSVSLLPYHPHL